MTRRPARPALAALAAVLMAAAAAAPAAPALAQGAYAAEKSMVDAGKARGQVGEQADGYLGFVQGPGDPALAAAVARINAARRQAYQDVAARTGVTPDAAGVAAAKLLIAKVPAGEYYATPDGQWVKR